MALLRNDPAPLGKVLLLPGDGIGPEVMREVRRAMDWFARRQGVELELDEGLVGGISYDRHGTPLTEAVMELSLAATATWWPWCKAPVSVNLSAANVTDLDLPEKVSHALRRHGLPPVALKLELVEDTFMKDPVRAQHVLREVRQLGVAIAIVMVAIIYAIAH